MDGPVEIPSTIWTAIATAHRQGGEALDALLRKYRPPVLASIRSAGIPPDEAEDLTQEVFLTLVKHNVLEKADRARGRFRSLLLGVTRHVMQVAYRNERRLKRGGDRKTTSLDEGGFSIEGILSAPETDASFDPLWIQNLVRLAMSRLELECRESGAPYFQALFLHTEEELAYGEIAARLGVALNDVKNYLHQARLRLKRHVIKEVHAYSSSRDEYDAEVAYLLRLLEGAGRPAP